MSSPFAGESIYRLTSLRLRLAFFPFRRRRHWRRDRNLNRRPSFVCFVCARHHEAKSRQVAKEVAERKLKILMTDSLRSCHNAGLKEFRTNMLETSTQHIRHITLAGTHHYNKMERLNGEIRERAFRGLKKPDTPLLGSYQIFHNYVRPHEGLKGKSPAEAEGIKVQGENKWLTLIQNASHKRTDVRKLN